MRTAASCPLYSGKPIKLTSVSNETRKSSDSGSDSGYESASSFRLPHKARATTEFFYASAAPNFSQSDDSWGESKADPQGNEPENGDLSQITAVSRVYSSGPKTSVPSNPCLKKIGNASSALTGLFSTDDDTTLSKWDACVMSKGKGKAIPFEVTPPEVNISNQKNKIASEGAYERLDDHLVKNCFRLGSSGKTGKSTKALLEDLSRERNHRIESTHLKRITSLFQIENEVLQAASEQVLLKEKLAGPEQEFKAARLKLEHAQFAAETAESELQALKLELASLLGVSNEKAMFKTAKSYFIAASSKLGNAALKPLQLDRDAAQSEHDKAKLDFENAKLGFETAKLLDFDAESKLQALKLQLITAALEFRTEALKLQQAVYKLKTSESNNAESELDSAIMDSEFETMQFQLVETEIIEGKSVDPEYSAVLEEKLKSAEEEAEKAERSARLLLETHAQSSAKRINKYIKEQRDLIKEQSKPIRLSNKTSRYDEINENLRNDLVKLEKNIKEKKYEGKDKAYYHNRMKSNIKELNSIKEWISEENKAQKEVKKGRDELQKISEAFNISLVQQLMMVFGAPSLISSHFRFNFLQWFFARPSRLDLPAFA